MPKILIAEDDRMIAAMIQQALSSIPGYEIVGVIHDGLQLCDSPQLAEVDFVLSDVVMPGLDGIQATKAIKQKFPHLKIIILSNQVDTHVIVEAIQAGANGYITKSDSISEIQEALTFLEHNSSTYFSKNFSQEKVLNLMAALSETQKTSPSALTGSEQKVMQAIVEGLSSKKIGEKLHISERTVQVHRRNILNKMDASNTASLVAKVIRDNIVKV